MKQERKVRYFSHQLQQELQITFTLNRNVLVTQDAQLRLLGLKSFINLIGCAQEMGPSLAAPARPMGQSFPNAATPLSSKDACSAGTEA